MSIKVTEQVLKDFLSSDKPEVLALTGAWGVGKTHVWNKAVEEHKSRIPFPKYCYVSLFGITSMAELRMALFLKSTSLGSVGRPLDFATVNKEWLTLSQDLFKKGVGKFGPLLKVVPHGGTVSLGLETLAPNLVRDTLFCFDDFERQTVLKPEEVLGLINELKEEKGCKIALIFNSEKLGAAAVYQSYKEKVVDYEVQYTPTVDEAFNLVFKPENSARDLVWPHVAHLGITNVRILRKVHTLSSMLIHATEGMHTSVLEDAIASAVLFCWCSYAPSIDKPNIGEITSWNESLFGFNRNGGEEVARPAWVERLKAYGFKHVSDLDISLARVVEQGYIAGSGFIEEAAKLDKEVVSSEMSEALSQMWDRFYKNFTGATDEFISDLHGAALHGVAHIGASELDNAVWLLRQLGRDGLADEVIEKYIESHIAEPEVFDLSEHPFGGSIDDITLRARFATVHASLVHLPGLEESLYFMVNHSGYNPEHIDALRKATVDEYEALFLKEHRDVKLPSLIKWCLRWDGENSEIKEKAKQALQRIAVTSPLNAVRVGRYLV